MVTVDIILQEYLKLEDYAFAYPLCSIRKSKVVNNIPKRGWICINGIEFNIARHTKMDVLFYINFKKPYFILKGYPTELFGFKLYVDNFVYGCLYSAIAAYLLSCRYSRLPVFFGFCFKTYKPQSVSEKYPTRYIKGFRYAHKDLLLVGKLILEEWLKMKRKENHSFMLEMSLN